MKPKFDDMGISIAEVYWVEKENPIEVDDWLIWPFYVSEVDIYDNWIYGQSFDDFFERATYYHVFSSRRVSI